DVETPRVATTPVAETPAPVRPAAPVASPEPTVAAPVAAEADTDTDDVVAPPPKPQVRIVSVGPGGFLRQGPGDQQAPIPPAPPRRLIPAKPSADIAGKTSLLDLTERICKWPMGHPGEPDFHFCGVQVNPGFPYCVEHCGRAYQAQLPRGTRRPPPPLPFGGPRVR
ncbi:MAG: GcrA family cell cycle regulator, partial [bacterium]|nr:GcrA family cell cycle regulator [bacterium]